MILGIIGTLALLLGLLAVTLQRLYSSVPMLELKRQAAAGDALAKALYRPVAYGSSLRLFLWTVAALFLVLGSMSVVASLGLVSFVVLGLMYVVLFVVSLSVRLTMRTAGLASAIAGPLSVVVGYLHPMLSRVADFAHRHRRHELHSGIYEKSDLHALLDQQKMQVDNRVSPEDIELAQRALTFVDKKAADVVLPRSRAYVVSADETLGPVLLDQLHKSRQRAFLVYKDTQENIIGSLAMRDAVAAKHGGRVFDLVRHDLCFVHEEFSLQQVLAALLETHQHVAVVINSFEECVGTIDLTNLLHELAGALPEGQEQYDDRASIAGYRPQLATEPVRDDEPEVAEEPGEASPVATEVVE